DDGFGLPERSQGTGDDGSQQFELGSIKRFATQLQLRMFERVEPEGEFQRTLPLFFARTSRRLFRPYVWRDVSRRATAAVPSYWQPGLSSSAVEFPEGESYENTICSSHRGSSL